MEEFLMKPKIDFAFKEMMENEDARKGFLAAVLKLDPADIRETRIMNPYLRKVREDDKLGILDVRILLNNDTVIGTEINLSRLKIWPSRSLFYTAKMYTDQINPGDSYDKLMKCVSISILDFKLFPDEPNFYSSFHLWEDTRHFLYTDQMEFHVLELPKLPLEWKEDGNNILLWAKFINAERKEEFEMLANRDPYIASAYQHLQIISQDQEKRAEYEARERALRDHNQMMRESREEGLAEGMAKGVEKGRAEGMAKGVEKGRAEGFETGRAETRREIVQRLLNIMPPGQVADALGMPLEDIRQMMQEAIPGD